MIVEFKYGKTATTGFDQIINKKYNERLDQYKDKLLLISINYDQSTKSNSNNFKHHTCKIMPYNQWIKKNIYKQTKQTKKKKKGKGKGKKKEVRQSIIINNEKLSMIIIFYL